ncbi:pilus assembly protein [Ralstonia sp. 24A2]|uniref:pilus assembly protein n=1 Tax=Ralstonia sp. 24A2 TaxID=3447364 RepID=UPI003F695081
MMEKIQRIVLFATVALLPGVSRAQQVISDTLTGTTSTAKWFSLNGACLTAGTNPVYDPNTNPIPGCSGLAYYTQKNSTLVGGVNGTFPEAAGSGALRLTNGDTGKGTNGNSQNGAVVSNFTIPTNQGVQVTFTTVTYGGNAYKNSAGVGSGADGIGFFLSDGSLKQADGKTDLITVGALGGSLGYSCSNVNGVYDGVAGGYIGLGIDEFGNFSNSGDNTSSGAGGSKPSRISLRGAGNTNWLNLSTKYAKYYPSSGLAVSQQTAVQSTCKAGYLYNYSGSTQTDANNQRIGSGYQTTEKLPYNYNYITGKDLGISIANQQAVSNPTRANGVPITYGISITQDGILNVSYSVNGGTTQTVIKDQSITAQNGPLPPSFRFGFSAGTGSGSNIHEITCFKAAPIGQSSSSAGTNVQQSARVEAGTQVYLAYYHPTNWWGELTAQNLMMDPVTGIVTINGTANWNASCKLTGGACQAMGSNVTVTAQAPTARNILTWNDASRVGIPFEWANLTSAQQQVLTAGDSSATADRLSYLRGDRTKEVATGGSFRTRAGVLGDIMNSSPTWVGAPSAPYNGPWVDALNASATPAEPAGSYAAFKSQYATRQNVVYVGANDGMLHGFRAGAYDATGNFVGNSASTPNDGAEAIAYMPATVLNTIHSTDSNLDFSATAYTHNLYVDATPGTGELFYNGAWHTWLVGGLGGGGNATGAIGDNTSQGSGAIYALDITNPSTFTEGNAGSLVVGEWSSSTITCSNVANCGQYLGSTYGTPVIRRLHNGYWAVLFGNGLNSQQGSAGLFVMLVNPSDGTKTFYYFDTGAGPSGSTKNGIAYVTPADLDGDHITDYVYAGDLLGNVWRFDLTSANPSSWAASSSPLFTTSTGQPITSKVAVASIPGTGTGQPRVLVSFGTGQALPQTLTAAATYSKTVQALYGIWDWDMSAWNSKASASARYASLTGPQNVTTTSLLTQNITAQSTSSANTPSYRTVSNNKVCWQGSTACGSGNTQYGWTLPLPSTTTGSGATAVTNYEQVVYNPTLAYGMFIVNTTIPAVQQVLSCTSTPASGYTMAVAVGSGGAASQSFFGDNNNNFPTYNGGIVSGIGLSATGTPSIVTANKLPYLVQQTTTGTGVVNQINPGAAGVGSRLNWVKLR